ncbi:MAG TPA: LLM class flavin-dependent oxidoreductase, partial [Ilumatobacteraceae bacterium]|nr:LLM class flavin-dependent oxidoreductase [Ilumatobacteraceae bacterium]
MATLDNDALNAWRQRLGRLGVWSSTEGYSAADAAGYAKRLQEWGYSTLWLPEAVGRDPFTHTAHLANAADALLFATGIANIHHRIPGVMMQAANTLAEQTGNRFILGLGVSHA